MNAIIIPFEKIEIPKEIITCSFCNKIVAEGNPVLITDDHKKCLCPACMVKCDILIKAQDESVT